MDVKLFDYYLPEQLISQSPSKIRDECRLLSYNKNTKEFKDEIFKDILKYFSKDDVLVINTTRVIPCRLFAIKEETKAHIEILMLRDLGNDVWKCLIGNAKTAKIGSRFYINDNLSCEVVEILPEGIRHMKFFYKGILMEELDKIGEMPLPPYIHKKIDDKNLYQTIYAKQLGSAAAPTAGFHFTNELLSKIKEKGTKIVEVILHVGLGTFRPVKVEDTKDHKMHEEEYFINEESAEALNYAYKNNKRIVACGTTSVRVLESNFSKYGSFKPTHEFTDIFIEPGYKWKVVNALITNFHLPKSTLLMLVSSFMGREEVLRCYEHAIEEKYRFFSFGDAMFIYGKD